MSLNMNMNMNMNMTPFRQNHWDSDLLIELALPNFFKNFGGDPKKYDWQNINLPNVPGFDETKEELHELILLQNDHELRKQRRDNILMEARNELPYFGRVLVSNPLSYPHTYRVMRTMLRVGTITVMYYKKKFSRARPTQLEPKLRPMIDVPGHPAYPSGHATQAYLIAHALTTVVRDLESGREMFNVARDIAINREIAGVHYRSDSIAGEQLAKQLFPLVLNAFEDFFYEASSEWL